MYSDIKTYIYKNISDIDTLVNACSTDTRIRDECAKFSFWKPIFEQYSLPLPNEPYNTAKEWIDEYTITRESKELTDKIINYINSDNKQVYLYPIDLKMTYNDIITPINRFSFNIIKDRIVSHLDVIKQDNNFEIFIYDYPDQNSVRYIMTYDQLHIFIFDILYAYCIRVEYENIIGELVDSDENCSDDEDY